MSENNLEISILIDNSKSIKSIKSIVINIVDKIITYFNDLKSSYPITKSLYLFDSGLKEINRGELDSCLLEKDERASNLTLALMMLNEKLTDNEADEKALLKTHVVFLISEGWPTTPYQKELEDLSKNENFHNYAIGVGSYVNRMVLEKFAGDKNDVLLAGNEISDQDIENFFDKIKKRISLISSSDNRQKLNDMYKDLTEPPI